MFTEALRGKCTDVCNLFWNTSKKYTGSIQCWMEGKCTDGEIHDKARFHSGNYSGTEVAGMCACIVTFINFAPYLKTS